MSNSTKAAEVDINNVLTVKRRPAKAAAVQFTGKNGKEVVAFVSSYYGDPELKVTNRGSYVSFQHPDNLKNGKVRKGDYAVVDANGALLLLPPSEFAILFSIANR